MENDNDNIVIGEAAGIITYGADRPDEFEDNGDTFAIRVLDRALLQSTIGG